MNYRRLSFALSVIQLAVFTALAGCSLQKTAETNRDRNGNGKLDLYEDANAPIEQRVEDILGRMTLEQKVNMVRGAAWSDDQVGGEGRVPGVAGYTYGLDNLGIPPIALADGPAGLRIQPLRGDYKQTYYATAFPVETLLASTWDKDLLQTIGSAMGDEVKEYGVDVLLAPGMNIHRNPRGGRNFEYYSEDPYLSGYMAAAMVNGVESVGVGATVKHFVANNQETNRYLIDTIVSERALREIYLRGFQIAVQESDPWAVMSAYNQVNGEPASQSKALMSTVLRDEWGFNGLVMTDWFAGDDVVAQMLAGNELLMPGTDKQSQELSNAVESGKLDEAVLDNNIRRILNVVLRSPTFMGYDYSDKPDLKAHAEIARNAAAEGVVLLKNNNGILPLKNSFKNIAAFGNVSYEFISGGTGSGDVNEAYTVSLVQALKQRGYAIDPNLQTRYENFIREEKTKLPEKKFFFELQPPIPEMPVAEDVLTQQASTADIALITIGRNSGEFQDRNLDGDFYLTQAEQGLIDGVAHAFHEQNKSVVLILNIGNVVETVSWRDKVDAIVLPWQGGQEAGNALADVLTGAVNPSGKLPTTFPVVYDDVPSAKNFPGVDISPEPIVINKILTAKRSYVKYEEDIYVGYRHYDKVQVEPAYEFGYGLSYTHFNYEPVTLDRSTFTDSIVAKVTVTNSGDVPGREVAQLYLTAPKGKLDKPVKELKGFVKTRQLQPGESQQLVFELRPQDLASFHESRSAWLAESGTYTISIGASSRDIRSTTSFNLDNEIIVEKTLADLSPLKKLE